jgi:hypothetical protein
LTKYEDADEMMVEIFTRDDGTYPISPVMRDAIFEADNGPEVLYNLWKNPKEMRRIASLRPAAQALELGRLSVRLSTQTPTATTVSKAPEPIKPVNAGRAPTSTVPTDNDDIRTWMKKRNKQTGREAG